MQTKTKGRLLIALLVTVSGLVGGALAAHLGRTDLEIVVLAVLFGAGAYLLLVLFVFTLVCTAVKEMQRMNNDK